MKVFSTFFLLACCLILIGVTVTWLVRNFSHVDKTTIHSLPFSVGDANGVLEISTGPRWVVTAREHKQYGTAARVCSVQSGGLAIDIMVDVAGGEYVLYANSLSLMQPGEAWRSTINGHEYHVRHSRSGSFAVSDPIELDSESLQLIFSANFDLAPDKFDFLSLRITPNP